MRATKHRHYLPILILGLTISLATSPGYGGQGSRLDCGSYIALTAILVGSLTTSGALYSAYQKDIGTKEERYAAEARLDGVAFSSMNDVAKESTRRYLLDEYAEAFGYDTQWKVGLWGAALTAAGIANWVSLRSGEK